MDLNILELTIRYQDIEIHPDNFFENILSILRHLTRVEQKKLGSEVNRTLWSTSPAVVNAYYSRNKNQIMFPAGKTIKIQLKLIFYLIFW